MVYYYDGTTQQYKLYGGGTTFNQGITVNGGSQEIPAGQSFFVKSTVAGHGNPLTLKNAARVHTSQAFWRGNNRNNINLVRLQAEKDGYTDETVIRTLVPASGVTEEHDGAYDAYKMFSWDTQNHSYTLSTQAIATMLQLTVFQNLKAIKLYH